MSGLDDLVFENSVSTGTGNLTVTRNGGHQRISEPFGTGDNGAANPILFIVNTEAAAAEWEIAPCYMSDANTLVRGTPIKSSNSNAAVNFGAGLKNITNDIPASVQLTEGNMNNAERQNTLLSFIYQAKSFGGYRRFINIFADGYAATDGVSGGTVTNGAIDTSAKKVTQNSTGGTQTILATGANASGAGGFTLVDLGTALTAADVIHAIGVSSSAAQTIVVKIVKRNSAGNFDIVVSEGYSHPGGGFSDHVLASDYTIPGTGSYYVAAYAAAHDSTAAAGSRAFKSGDITGTGQTGFTEDTNAGGVPMRVVKTGTISNMTLVTTSQTADATVSNCRVLMEIDNTATPTLNTDLTAEVTCNNGTNWTSASLSSVGLGQTGRLVVESVDQACTSGTSFAARIKTFNNKAIPLYGLSVSAH